MKKQMNERSVKKESVIEYLIGLLVGYKYYVNVINLRGTDRIEMSSGIYRRKEDAESHRMRLYDNRSYGFVETVCFRSRKRYGRPVFSSDKKSRKS